MWKSPKCGRNFSCEGQSHYCGKIETVDRYIEEQDESVRPYLNEVRRIIRSALPEAQEKISWSMPTYWKGQNLIHFAASKKHLGLYPGGEATTVFAEKLVDYPDSTRDDMLFIGDTYETDIVGAHNAGLRTVWINRKNVPDINGFAVYQIKDITDLRKYHIV